MSKSCEHNPLFLLTNQHHKSQLILGNFVILTLFFLNCWLIFTHKNCFAFEFIPYDKVLDNGLPVLKKCSNIVWLVFYFKVFAFVKRKSVRQHTLMRENINHPLAHSWHPTMPPAWVPLVKTTAANYSTFK